MIVGHALDESHMAWHEFFRKKNRKGCFFFKV